MLQPSKSSAWSYLSQRFGVEKKSYENMFVRSDSAWLTTSEVERESVGTPGIRAVRFNKFTKPTTYILQYLGGRLRSNKVSLTRTELMGCVSGEIVSKESEVSEGYVALAFRERVLGCGLYKDESVSSRIPKHKASEIRRVLKE